MASVGKPADRNVDGILHYMRDFLNAREQQVIRMNPRIENVIGDIVWIHLEILKHVLQRPKVFGGEKFRVADVLAGFDDNKRRALLSASDQNSILDEIIDRPDEATGKKAADMIHDMRTLFRSIDPALENVAQLIQYWVKWDLQDASDLHSFDEQSRRLTALRGIQLTDEIKNRYRQALGKPADSPVSDSEIYTMELHRLEQIANRYCARRSEDEPYQLIIRRDIAGSPDNPELGEPYDYKHRQCETIATRLENERLATEQKLAPAAAPAPAQSAPASEAIELEA